MACPLCDQDHGLLDCIEYVSTPQPLKDFLGNIFDRLPLIQGPDKPWEKIYDHFYAQAPPAVWEDSVGSTIKPITQRIYLAVQPNSLLKVWSLLKPLQSVTAGFSFAKRCTVADAARRLDTIVLYTADVNSRDALIDIVRHKLRDPLWSAPWQRTALTVPPRLVREDFKAQVLPGTGRIADLQGVSIAQDPGPGTSFGEKLSQAAADAYEEAGPKGFLQSRKLFVGFALGRLSRAHQINIRAPWKPQV